MNLINNNVERRFDKVSSSKVFRRILKSFNLDKKKVLDIGCGYGEHLSFFGKDSLGLTTIQEGVDYGKSHNLNILKGNVEEIKVLQNLGYFDYIWANNIFEHLLSPHAFLVKLKTISSKKTMIILGVPVIPKISLLLKLKKFRGSLASSHINFFTKETLKHTVQSAGWEVLSLRSFIFSNLLLDMCISFLSPHLYVIAVNQTDFRYSEKKEKEWEGEELYKDLFEIIRESNRL